MKKFIIILFLNLVVADIVLSEEYYFKKCKLSEKVTADYLINIEKKQILVTLKPSEGDSQNFTDGIKLITKDRIVSEIIQQKNKIFSTQYFLDANSKSVFRQMFKKEVGIDLIMPEGPQKKSYCKNVKANWSEKKEEKKEEKILDEKLQVKSSLKKCIGENNKNWSNCLGTYISGNRYKYTGEWKDGKQDGNGAEIWRDGKKVTTKVSVGELREEQASLPSKSGDSDKDSFKELEISSIGIKLASINPLTRNQFKLKKSVKGVVITFVSPSGAAAEQQLKPGDVIIEVGQTAVSFPKDVREKIKEARKAGKKSVLLLMERQNGIGFVAIRLAKKLSE